MEEIDMEQEKPHDPIKRGKNGFPVGVTINPNGTLTVDPVELLKQPEVQRLIDAMAKLQKEE